MIKDVRMQTDEYMNADGSIRRVDNIAVFMMDMWFKSPIMCQRDEYLAGRLAKEAGVELFDHRDGANAPPPLSEEEKLKFGESLKVFNDMVGDVDR